MPYTDPTTRAELIESIHQPWKATLGDCLQRWDELDPGTRAQSYLVIQDHAGTRLTLNATKIAALKADVSSAHFRPCDLSNRAAGFGLEDVGEVEQIVVA